MEPMTQNEEVRIEIAFTESERSEAIAFIEHFMRETFNCDPPPTTGVIFVARAEGQIVGSIVLAGTDGEMPFSIESHYTFEPSTAAFPFMRTYIVEGSRWLSSRKELSTVSSLLILHSFTLAYEFGKRYMLIEAKPYSIKHLGKLGVLCHPIEGATLRREHLLQSIGERSMRYFIESPEPTLYMLELLPSIKELSRLQGSQSTE
jgi:hypothetical protein